MFESWSAVAAPPGVRAWSKHAPDGLLADQLCFEPAGDCADRLERVAAWDRQVCWSQARQIREIGELLAAARSDPAFGAEPEQLFRSMAAEVGAMLRLAPRTAEDRVGEAVVFLGRLPGG